MTDETDIILEGPVPAEATQVVEPIVAEPAGAGETAILEPVVPETSPEEEDKTPVKPKKKHRGLIVFLVLLSVLLGAAAALEFVPGSPFEHTIRWLIDPPTQLEGQLTRTTGLETVSPEMTEIEFGAILDVPADWEYIPEPEPELDPAAEPVEEAEGEEPQEPAEPTASEKLRDLRDKAFRAIQEGTLATSSITVALVPQQLDFVPEDPFEYAPGNRADVIAEAASDALDVRYTPVEVVLSDTRARESISLEPGSYMLSATAYVFDEFGFVWQTDAIEGNPLSVSFNPASTEEVLFYRPVDLAALTDGELSVILDEAGTYADTVSSLRTLMMEAAAEPEPAIEPESEPEPEPDTEEPTTPSTPSQGGTTPGGNGGSGGSSGGTTPGGNGGGSTPGGNGGGSGNGGTTPGGNSGGDNPGGNGGGTNPDPDPPTPTHTHTVASRTWDEQRPVYTHIEGHYETVHHDAVYNDWHETRSICNDCGADITGFADDHIRSTGHSFHTQTVYHHDLVTEAYDEQVWVAAHDEVTGYTWVTITETYCTECGEVLSHSEW